MLQWIRLYSHILESERRYNLLVRYSLAFASFWLLIIFAPSLPQIGHIAEVTRFVTKNLFLGLTVRDILIVLIPAILGLLYISYETYEDTEGHTPFAPRHYTEGFAYAVDRIADRKELLLFVFLCMGKGLRIMFNWILNYLFLLFFQLYDSAAALLGLEIPDTVLIQGKPDDILKTASLFTDNSAYIAQTQISVFYALKNIQPQSVTGRIACYIITHIFGSFVFIRTGSTRIMVSETGVAISGNHHDVRDLLDSLYYRINLSLIKCTHPLSAEVERKINEGHIPDRDEIMKIKKEGDIPPDDFIIIKDKICYITS